MFWGKQKEPVKVKIVDDFERDERGEIVERDEDGYIVERIPSYRHLVTSVILSDEDLNYFDKSDEILEDKIQRMQCEGYELISTETYEYEEKYTRGKTYKTHLFFKKPYTSNYQIKERVYRNSGREDLYYRFQRKDEQEL